MSTRTRRELFADIGRGMIAASVGTTLAADLGFAATADGSDRLTFGDLDPLVNRLRDTPPAAVVKTVVGLLKSGTELRQLVAAAALTNARAFGGEDYIGFHTLMALAPAYQMSELETDPARRPLAVLKVLHRNAARLADVGPAQEILQPVAPGELAADRRGGEQVRDAVRKADVRSAETTFAAVCRGTPADALNELMLAVDDATEVHRVVLVSRAWDLTRFVGAERAGTLLRQSVRYCVNSEKHPNTAKSNAALREQLPTLLDRYKLLGRTPSLRSADDAWVAAFADTLFRSDGSQAADAVAAALADGFSPDDVGEALALTANQLVLRDAGRPKQWASANKPVGSVHGDSVGVHSCDTIHAWRHLARVGDRRTQVTSLILAGYQVGRDRGNRPEFPTWEPYPRAEHAEAVRAVAADALLKELDAAVRAKDQPRAAAVAARIGAERPDDVKAAFAVLRGYAISEEGALHAEKFYATAADEYARTRPAFRGRHLTALARVTASSYGFPAPAHGEAVEALKG